jgi:hypothetical protein
MKLDRILVPLDGSVLAEAALGTVIDLAGADEVTLSLRGTTTPILIVRSDTAPVAVPAGAGSAKEAANV